METIILEPEDVWGFIEKNYKELSNDTYEIARNDYLESSVGITCSGGIPKVVITVCGEKEYEEEFNSEYLCADSVEYAYDTYIYSSMLPGVFDDDDILVKENDEDEQELEIEYRESEIDDAFAQFIDTVLSAGSDPIFLDDDDAYDDIKEHILEYIARKWGADIYRPAFLQDNEGREIYVEHPYSVLKFPDEDNPIYKPVK